MYNIVHKRRWWYVISVVVLIPGVIALILGGLRSGIDFKGGSLMRISFEQGRPATQEASDAIAGVVAGEFFIQPVEETDILLRAKELTEEEQGAVVQALSEKFGTVNEQSFESVGPTIGRELRNKSATAIVVVLAFIILYISFAFRKVSSGPVKSWVYGVMAVVALAHDLLFVIGSFAILGYFFNVEVGALFVTALLTTLGFSVHDTIVVFDRVREHTRSNPAADFETTVNESVNQTMARSLNTSASTLLVLVCLYFFGGASIRDFVLALILGIIAGTYSSIFIASTLLVSWQKFTEKRRGY
ncbi:MAG: protein translocase subunit SecF [Patescibacteria group bacterium]|jgi:preprotein translocase subunit SecF